MENTQININDFVLEVDYEIRDAEPENGIEAGFDPIMVIIKSCDLFDFWEETLEVFKSELWGFAPFDDLANMVREIKPHKEFDLNGLKCFCTVDCMPYTEFSTFLDIILNYKTRGVRLVLLAGEAIQGFVCEDMRSLNITPLIDSYEIEQRIKQQL